MDRFYQLAQAFEPQADYGFALEALNSEGRFAGGNSKVLASPLFDWLERAYDEHDVHLIFLPIDPKWESLRGESQFAEIVRRRLLAANHGAAAEAR